MKIAVVGAGFVSEATGRGFAKHKNEVTFVDIDAAKIAALRAAGFDAQFAQDYDTISTDVTMFCVPTPTKAKRIQLKIIRDAVVDFSKRLKDHKKYHIIVIRSTVPPHTTRDKILPLIEKSVRQESR